jgi:hypothetical protein
MEACIVVLVGIKQNPTTTNNNNYYWDGKMPEGPLGLCITSPAWVGYACYMKRTY